jgi:hypothetical protein
MRLLREAERLVDTDARRALALLRKHAEDHPDSPLAIERTALRIMALCGAGRISQGSAAKVDFIRAHPASPYLARVEAACASED